MPQSVPTIARRLLRCGTTKPGAVGACPPPTPSDLTLTSSNSYCDINSLPYCGLLIPLHRMRSLFDLTLYHPFLYWWHHPILASRMSLRTPIVTSTHFRFSLSHLWTSYSYLLKAVPFSTPSDTREVYNALFPSTASTGAF